MAPREGLRQRARADQDPDYWFTLEPSPKWLRVVFGGEVVVDSKRTHMLRERGHTPVYYFPQEDVRMDLLLPTNHTTHDQHKGDASYWTLKVGDRVADRAAWSYTEPPPGSPDLRGYLAFRWNDMDGWFEEDEEVFVHPRDPYKRVDVIESSRHVRVVVAGETVADTRHPVLLFETGLPTRYYIPKVDARMDLLVPSDRTSRCPYKGDAGYYSVKVGDTLKPDIAWYYRHPTSEAAKIAGRMAFFNERVDALYVDGEEQPKPRTRWS